jgi:hypothetical protein
MTKLDTELLTKLNEAVKAANVAERSVTTAQAELVSRSKAVGMLLLEAKKLHPKGEDFYAFLKKVHGLKPSRAYDLMRLAGGRTTDEELKKENRERQQKSRAKKKLPTPESEPASVTVTEISRKFTKHVLELVLITADAKPATFADTTVRTEDLAKLGTFLAALASHLRKQAEPRRDEAA